MSTMNSKIVLAEAYDVGYGIFDHDNDRLWNPLSMVAMHSTEEVDSCSGLERIIRRFLKAKLYKHTGLDLKQYLELPRDVANIIFELATEVKVEDDEYVEELLGQLKGDG